MLLLQMACPFLQRRKLTKVSFKRYNYPLGNKCVMKFLLRTQMPQINHLQVFWETLKNFFLAYGSKLNHSKTRIGASFNPPPPWLLNQRCEIIREGQIFCLLGIPIKFRDTLKQIWDWALTKNFIKNIKVALPIVLLGRQNSHRQPLHYPLYSVLQVLPVAFEHSCKVNKPNLQNFLWF